MAPGLNSTAPLALEQSSGSQTFWGHHNEDFHLHLFPFCLNLGATSAMPLTLLDSIPTPWHSLGIYHKYDLMKFSQPAHKTGSLSISEFLSGEIMFVPCPQAAGGTGISSHMLTCGHGVTHPGSETLLTPSKHSRLLCLCFSHSHPTASATPFKLFHYSYGWIHQSGSPF